MTFTDDDLKRLKEELSEIRVPTKEATLALLARLEAAEQVIADIAYPDHGFFKEKCWRTAHYEAWRKECGK